MRYLIIRASMLPPPASYAFLPALLAHIHDAAEFPVDNVVLQSVLLCLVARKHLILRTQEEDISHVIKLTTLVLASVFGISTTKVRLRAQHLSSAATDPTHFVRSLFLSGSAADGNDLENHTSSGSLSKRRSRKLTGTAATRLRPQSARSPLSHSTTSTRSSSFPDGLPADAMEEWQHLVASASVNIALPSAHPRPSISINNPFDTLSTAHSHHTRGHNPFAPDATTDIGHGTTPSPKSLHHPKPLPSKRPANRQSNTDPTPLTLISRTSTPGADAPTPPPQLVPPQLSSALVVSGLEHVGAHSHRALATILHEKKVVIEESEISRRLCLPLPENFILVYVCPLDQRERPRIHRTLLDRFAMSATVTLQPNVRMAIRSSSFTTSHVLASPSLVSHPLPHRSSTSTTVTSSQSQNHSHHNYISPHILTPKSSPASLPLPLPHSPSSPAAPSHPHPSTEPIIPLSFLADLRIYWQHTTIPPLLQLYLADLLSATRHYPLLDASFLTLRAHHDAEDLIRAARVLGGDPTGVELVAGMSQPAPIEPIMIDNHSDSSEGNKHRHHLHHQDRDEYGTMFEDLTNGSDTIRLSFARTTSSSATTTGRIARVRSSAISGGEDISIGGESHDLATSLLFLHEDLSVPMSSIDVSEADVARMIPRVVTHRVRVRAGIEEEVLGSAVRGAVAKNHSFDGREGEGGEMKTTIKDILVRILAEV